MIKRTVDPTGKGWSVGPWNSSVPIAVGYADIVVNEPHTHHQMHEIYLVARGASRAFVGDETVVLGVGDVLVVEPGETHAFLDSSTDYLHFVIQAPFVPGDKTIEPTPD